MPCFPNFLPTAVSLTSSTEPFLVDDLGCILLAALAMDTLLHNTKGTPVCFGDKMSNTIN